jgi:hypothetical protein
MAQGSRPPVLLLARHRVRFVCISVVLMAFALLVVSFATADQGQTVFGPPLGADYAGFYVAGTLLNTAPPERLYDFARQDAIYHAVLPRDQGHLPYLYPPFVALAFRPLAQLPYTWSFAAWLVLSGGLYIGGLLLALRALPSLPRSDRPLIVLIALSFEPFVMECWLGGQLSALGFFCMALAWYCQETGRPVAAGAALGCCLYKPTLLVLFLPLLMVGRCWRQLAGFAMTAVVLAGISLAAVGWATCVDYARLLVGFAGTTSGSEGVVLPAAKYIDLNSFLRLLLGSPSLLSRTLMLVVVMVPLGALAAAWWRLGNDGGSRRVVWAATLTWTLVANLYVGVYDSILIVLSALLTADALAQPRRDKTRSGSQVFHLFLLLLYIAPWLSQHLARGIGLQVYTVILLAFGVYQLALIRALSESDDNLERQEEGAGLPAAVRQEGGTPHSCARPPSPLTAQDTATYHGS